MYVVRIEDLKVSVGGNYIIKNFNLLVSPNSIVLIRGPSGSGKSTLLKVLAGLIPNIYRKFRVDGLVEVFSLSPEEAVKEGLIAYIPQDMTTFFLGSKVHDEFEVLGRWLDEFRGLSNKYVSELSDGQLYKLLISIAVLSGVKLLLLDEPTSHMDKYSLVNMIASIRRLCSEVGLTVLVVDHRVELIKDYVDVVVNLGSEVNDVKKVSKVSRRSTDGYNVVVKDLWFDYDGYEVFRGLNMSVRRGEVFSVLGRNGSGKSTLLKILANILKARKGYVSVSKPIFYIPQRPLYWFTTNSVYDEVSLYVNMFRRGIDVDEVLNEFKIKYLSSRNPYTLSVGEVRRLSLALAYIASPNTLLIDEPTLGLDSISSNVLEWFLDVFRGSRSVVLATHYKGVNELVDNSLILGFNHDVNQ
jgi:energy-coupling factor transport system ATP-binding protein